MTTQTITLDLPEPLYQKLKVRATQARRSVEDELLDLLAAAVPVADELPDDLTAAITPLAMLDDAELWRAAQTRLPPDVAARLEELHLKRQRAGLTEPEEREAATLVRQYERVMLVRAQAAALLKQRGHDVSGLLAAA